MNDTRKIRSVSFNLDDPYEEKLNNHAKKFREFSVYVKRLIQRDMEWGWNHNQSTAQHEESPEEDDQGFIESLI